MHFNCGGPFLLVRDVKPKTFQDLNIGEGIRYDRKDLSFSKKMLTHFKVMDISHPRQVTHRTLVAYDSPGRLSRMRIVRAQSAAAQIVAAAATASAATAAQHH